MDVKECVKLLHDIKILERKVADIFEKKLEISLTRFQIIKYLYEVEVATPKQIAQILKIDAAAITRHLKKLEEGGFATNDHIFVKLEGITFSMPISKMALVGKHNVANCLVASIVAKLLNISNDNLEKSLKTFQAVEHRLEKFAEIDGVNYINDSKATNVNATYFALESMETPVIWIVGGVDKGNDYSEVEDLVKEKVKAIICLGLNNEKIIKFFQGKKEMIFDTSNIEDCVKMAKNIAQEGDSVLLSPCCASFDLFDNYEDRGKKFKAEVLR